MAKMSEAHHQVAKLMALPNADAVLAGHRWPHELERWHELVACLFVSSISLPDREVRRIVELLRLLGILDINEWAKASASDGEGRDIRTRTQAILTDEGIKPAEAKHALTALHEVASSLKSRHKGKIQLCLRGLSEAMLKALAEELDVTGVPPVVVKEALTLWLQNVANLPISVDDDQIRRFCEAQGIDKADLVQAADDLDVNVAVLDDLIQLSMRKPDDDVAAAKKGRNA